MARVLFGIGSNLEPESNISAALQLLKRSCANIKLSPAYFSTALDQNEADYLNLVIAAETALNTLDLLQELKEIEALCGRRRGENCALDLDLLCYEEMIGEFDGITLPRNDITDYAHVLKPLSELLPDTKHPVLEVSYSALWDQKSAILLENQQLTPHSFI